MAAKKRRPKKAEQPPWLADPKANDKLLEAAAAVEMTVEELVGLAVDSGALTLPPTALESRAYSLEDLGHKLHVEMRVLSADERPVWFGELVEKQQTALVCCLKDKGFSTQVIARDLGEDPVKIARIWNTYADRMGEQVVGLRLTTIAGQVHLAKEEAQAMARSKGNHSAFWKIEKEYVALLQTLGVVDRATHRIEHSHKIDDEQQQEIAALVDLAAKKNAAAADLKLIKEAEFDVVPSTLDALTEELPEELT